MTQSKPAILALDMDGTILNYGSHLLETRCNLSLLALLPRQRQPVAILTNQGGMALWRSEPNKYPSPERVAERIYAAVRFLREAGWPVEIIIASCYHPRAEHVAIQSAAAKLRGYMPQFGAEFWLVYTAERARKPHPLMLKAAGATVYYGDSPEDGQAAQAAGIPFVAVPRFE